MAQISSRILRFNKEDEPLLRRIGYAVLVQWDELDGDARDAILGQAVFLHEPHHEVVQVRESFLALVRKHRASRKPAVTGEG